MANKLITVLASAAACACVSAVSVSARAAAVVAAASFLSPAAAQTYYWRYPLLDAPGEDISNLNGVTDQLMTACNALPNCAAFNSDGWLKNSIAVTNASTCDLYVKKTVPQPPRLSVVPTPTSVTNGSTMLIVSPSLSFIAGNASPDLSLAFARYQALLFPTAVSQPAHIVFPRDQPTLTTVNVNVVDVTVPLQLGVDESYKITVPSDGSAATINANTVYGAYRGLETLSQLVHFDFELGVYRLDFAPLTIADAPAFAYRGLLIDTSRHFEPVRTIQAVLDSMSYAKLNVLHWHIVDYQSWPVQSNAYPLLWDGAWSPRERYTLADLAAVVEYARQRGIMVIPEFDTPGHADAVCTGYPQACPAPNCTSPLNPATNFTFQLIQGVLAEWANIFPSDYMHLGGDEVDTACWSSSPQISAWMASKGYTPDQTYEYFVLQTDVIANNLGKNAVRWEEVWNHFGTQLPKQTVIHVWLDHATLANVTGNGYFGILSDNDVYYLDHLDLTWQNFYDNDLLAGIAPGAVKYVLGGETCMWGETVDTSDILQTIWPRAAAAAERQWSYYAVHNSSDAGLYERMTDFRCLLNSRGVAAAPLNNPAARSSPPGPGSCTFQ